MSSNSNLRSDSQSEQQPFQENSEDLSSNNRQEQNVPKHAGKNKSSNHDHEGRNKNGNGYGENNEENPQRNQTHRQLHANHSDNIQNNEEENQGNNPEMPFFIESFNREERQKQRANKPKLGLKRLTEDKKLVSVDIDIPIDQNTIVKDKFDWDLSKDKISPSDFAKELVNNLKLPEQFIQKIKQQILSQIMEHIKANTCQKPQQRETFMNEDQTNFNRNNMRFNYTEYPEDELLEKEQNEKKKMSRMRRNQMKRTTTYLPTQPNRYFKQKKMCRNCKNQNNAPGYECKTCKLPFQLMESLNFEDKRVKISAKYYEKIANKIPLLVYEAKKKNFEKEDFDSFYAIYNKIKGIFEQSDQLTKQHLNQVKYIMQKYHEYFLNGNLDFNDEEIIYDKDMKKGDKKQQDVKPKRARGRPRKIKIINDDLVPNSNQIQDEESSQSMESSSSDSSS